MSTLAPAWVADGRPVYGGFFWINGDGAWPIPKEAYSMNGAGQQVGLALRALALGNHAVPPSFRIMTACFGFKHT